jgi:hypothetical protein
LNMTGYQTRDNMAQAKNAALANMALANMIK